MSTQDEKDLARIYFNMLVERDALPSSLRLPLNRVIDGDETPGTAQGVLDIAKEILDKTPQPKRDGLHAPCQYCGTYCCGDCQACEEE